MELGNAWIVLNAQGSNVLKKNITPAEASLLRKRFARFTGNSPVTELEVLDIEATVATEIDEEGRAVKTRPRTNADEHRRLCQLYTEKAVSEVFPGDLPNFPQTFEEAGFSPGQKWQAGDVNSYSASKLAAPRVEDLIFTAGPALT